MSLLSLFKIVATFILSYNVSQNLINYDSSNKIIQSQSNVLSNEIKNNNFQENKLHSFKIPTPHEIKNMAEKVLRAFADDEESQKWDSKKKFTRGINKVNWSFPIGEVWLTKEFLGKVNTIIGVTGGTYTFIVTIITLILAMKVMLTAISGGILGFISGLLGLMTGATIAFLTSKINSYKYGGYFKFDYTGIPLITGPVIMSTVREQTSAETRKRVVPLSSKVKFGNNESFDFDYFDRTKAKIWIDWDYHQNDEDFIGVLDITNYSNYLGDRKLRKVTPTLFFETKNKEEFRIDDSEFSKFIKDYISRSIHDYLFVGIKIVGNKIKIKIGGIIYNEYSTNTHYLFYKTKTMSNENFKISNVGLLLKMEFINY